MVHLFFSGVGEVIKQEVKEEIKEEMLEDDQGEFKHISRSLLAKEQ